MADGAGAVTPVDRLVARLIPKAPECVHHIPGGDLVRPWTRTPQCPLCRRGDRLRWNWTYATDDQGRPL